MWTIGFDEKEKSRRAPLLVERRKGLLINRVLRYTGSIPCTHTLVEDVQVYIYIPDPMILAWFTCSIMYVCMYTYVLRMYVCMSIFRDISTCSRFPFSKNTEEHRGLWRAPFSPPPPAPAPAPRLQSLHTHLEVRTFWDVWCFSVSEWFLTLFGTGGFLPARRSCFFRIHIEGWKMD